MSYSEDAYYHSAYNQKLGAQGQAKGFWDWLADPNREGYDPGDVEAKRAADTAQNAAAQAPSSAPAAALGGLQAAAPLQPEAMPSVAAQETGGATAASAPPATTGSSIQAPTATSNFNPYAAMPSNLGFVDHAPAQMAASGGNMLESGSTNALQGLRSARKTLY